MKRLAKIVAVIAVVMFGLYYSVVTPSVSLRYRLTVNVDVNDVTHTGSGVVEITYQSYREWVMKSLPLDWARQFHGRMKGYAITVDLGDRGLLFVVNSNPYNPLGGGRPFLPGAALDQTPLLAYRSVFPRPDQQFPQAAQPSEIIDRARLIRRVKPEPIALSVTDLPMMVRFTNINNLRSLEEVDPRDLAAAFGPGVRLANVTFELTRDPVSPIPSIWPAWLKVYRNPPIDANYYKYVRSMMGTLAFSIGAEAFKGD